MAKKIFKVTSPVKFGGKHHASGAIIELEATEETMLRAAGVIGDEVVTDVLQVPTDELERIAAIVSAIGQLDVANTALWTGGGAPKTEALAAITGWPVAAKDRDAAWAELQKNSAPGK